MWWVTVVGGGVPHIAVWLKEVLLSHASLDVWVRLPHYPRDPVKEGLNRLSLELGGVFVASSCLDLVALSMTSMIVSTRASLALPTEETTSHRCSAMKSSSVRPGKNTASTLSSSMDLSSIATSEGAFADGSFTVGQDWYS